MIIFYSIIGFIFTLEVQVVIRGEIRFQRDMENRDWFNFTYENKWSFKKKFFYELFLLDLITCYGCGKLKAYKGKYCEDCKDEILKEEI